MFDQSAVADVHAVLASPCYLAARQRRKERRSRLERRGRCPRSVGKSFLKLNALTVESALANVARSAAFDWSAVANAHAVFASPF